MDPRIHAINRGRLAGKRWSLSVYVINADVASMISGFLDGIVDCESADPHTRGSSTLPSWHDRLAKARILLLHVTLEHVGDPVGILSPQERAGDAAPS